MKPLHFVVSEHFRSFRDHEVCMKICMDESIRNACSRNLIATLMLMRTELYERCRGGIERATFDELRTDEHGNVAFTSVPTRGTITLR